MSPPSTEDDRPRRRSRAERLSALAGARHERSWPTLGEIDEVMRAVRARWMPAYRARRTHCVMPSALAGQAVHCSTAEEVRDRGTLQPGVTAGRAALDAMERRLRRTKVRLEDRMQEAGVRVCLEAGEGDRCRCRDAGKLPGVRCTVGLLPAPGPSQRKSTLVAWLFLKPQNPNVTTSPKGEPAVNVEARLKAQQEEQARLRAAQASLARERMAAVERERERQAAAERERQAAEQRVRERARQQQLVYWREAERIERERDDAQRRERERLGVVWWSDYPVQSLSDWRGDFNRILEQVRQAERKRREEPK